MSRMVECIVRGEGIPRDWVAITLDDALQNQATVAAEVLRSHGCPWTLGVPAGLIGTGRSVWTYELRFLIVACWRFPSVPSPLEPSVALPTASDAERRATAQKIHHALLTEVQDQRRDEYLNLLLDQFGRNEFFERLASDGRFVLADWERLRTLQTEGVELASHGWTHRPQNGTISPESADQELVASRQRMEEMLGRSPAGFVLPNGLFQSETANRVRQAGYEYCLTTESWRVSTRTTPLDIPRFFADYPLVVLRRHLLRSS